MLSNRSMPWCTTIPELAYPNVSEAIEWLCDVFGFTLRLRIATVTRDSRHGCSLLACSRTPSCNSDVRSGFGWPSARALGTPSHMF